MLTTPFDSLLSISSMLTGIPPAKKGVSRLMPDFEFYLDTGNSPPVCCRQPVYSFNESKIMTAQITDLEANGILLIVKEPGVPYFYLPRNPTRKATTISIPSFGDFVLATDH